MVTFTPGGKRLALTALALLLTAPLLGIAHMRREKQLDRDRQAAYRLRQRALDATHDH